MLWVYNLFHGAVGVMTQGKAVDYALVGHIYIYIVKDRSCRLSLFHVFKYYLVHEQC